MEDQALLNDLLALSADLHQRAANCQKLNAEDLAEENKRKAQIVDRAVSALSRRQPKDAA